MKQKIKGKICAVFCFAGKKKLLFYIYAVIVKQKIYKRSSNHYCGPSVCLRARAPCPLRVSRPRADRVSVQRELQVLALPRLVQDTAVINTHTVIVTLAYLSLSYAPWSEGGCLSSAKIRSTDSVNPRAVLSRVRPRSRHLL